MWVVSVWRHVNDTLMQHVDGQCLIGPTQFMSCPADVEAAEEWFLGLWNMVLTPHLISNVQDGLQVKRGIMELEGWMALSKPRSSQSLG